MTGAASGVGAATARRLGAAGHRVGLVDQNADGLAAVASDLAPGTTACVQANVADESEAARAVVEVATLLGDPTILVTCAAIPGVGGLAELSKADWDRTMAVNVGGTFLFARAMVPYFEANGGAIVTVSSVAALAAPRGVVAYSASKGALVALTRALAVELAPFGVRANVVCPGTVDTPFARAAIELRGGGDYERGLENSAQSYLVGHVSAPSEIASVIAFLCSDDASFLSGDVIVADGGLLARLPLMVTGREK